MANDPNPVAVGGIAGHGGAVVLGPTTDGLGALRWLEKTDALNAKIKERAQATAQRQKDAEQKALLSKVKFATDGGIHYLPAMQAKRGQLYNELESLYTDPTKSSMQKQLELQQKMDDWNAELAAGKVNDDYLAKELQNHKTDKRINTDVAGKLLTDTLYQREADGSLAHDEQGGPKVVPALEWDRQAAAEALTKGNGHLVGDEIYSQFLNTIPENSITYSREALPGGQGFRNKASSDVFELEHGKIKRDPKTTRPLLRDSQETLVAFQSDPLNRQWLEGQLQQHQQVVRQATDKLQRREALTPVEEEAMQVEQSPAGPRMELFKKDLLRYGYQREESTLLQKPAHVDRTSNGRTQGPKFTRVGGTEYSPELVGGTASGGTSGLLSLASADPLGRVKADGTVQAHTARATHRQYVLLQNGQPSRLVTNNAEPQNLSYERPQLYLTTPTGNVATPKDPSLLQRYQQGDKQPLLDWVRAQREQHPGYAVKWHFQAVPSDGKLTGQNNAEQIYQRLVDDRTKANLTPGQSGYKGDDDLRSTAQKLAREQGGTLLIPYVGEDKRRIDLATGYMLREPKRQRQMQAQYEYFDRETAPRPAEQRAASAKKATGVDFGTAPIPTPTAQPAPTAPAFKRAGTKKTGIRF